MSQAIKRARQSGTVRGTLELAWEISPGAAGPHTRLEVSAAIEEGDGHGRVGPVEARLVGADRCERVDVGDAVGVCITDAETGLTHIDVPGVLHVSLRLGERPLYARTTIFERLGVGGGRYELVAGGVS